MITAPGLEFHHSAGDDYTRAETYYLPISMPAQRLFVHVYVCVRPVLGCMSSCMLDGGEVLALTGARASTTRLGIVPISTELEMTDCRGRTHRLHGVPLCGAPWRAYSTSVTWCGLMQWEYEGRIGHGSLQENRSLVVETGLRGRRWTDPVPALTG